MKILLSVSSEVITIGRMLSVVETQCLCVSTIIDIIDIVLTMLKSKA